MCSSDLELVLGGPGVGVLPSWCSVVPRVVGVTELVLGGPGVAGSTTHRWILDVQRSCVEGLAGHGSCGVHICGGNGGGAGGPKAAAS